MDSWHFSKLNKIDSGGVGLAYFAFYLPYWSTSAKCYVVEFIKHNHEFLRLNHTDVRLSGVARIEKSFEDAVDAEYENELRALEEKYPDESVHATRIGPNNKEILINNEARYLGYLREAILDVVS